MSRAPLRTVVAFLVASAPAALLSYRSRGIELEDALIYHRYLRNLLEGRGLTSNNPDTKRPGAGLDHLDGLRMTVLGNKEGVCIRAPGQRPAARRSSRAG